MEDNSSKEACNMCMCTNVSQDCASISQPFAGDGCKCLENLQMAMILEKGSKQIGQYMKGNKIFHPSYIS